MTVKDELLDERDQALRRLKVLAEAFADELARYECLVGRISDIVTDSFRAELAEATSATRRAASKHAPDRSLEQRQKKGMSPTSPEMRRAAARARRRSLPR